ncbi:ABC transporter ATP-binding protein, partial [Staphylococcus massiliensis]
LSKIYEKDVHAVKDFNLSIEDNEFIVFVGPSGCGKSTTLRMIAGLEDVSHGEIKVDGKVINQLQPKDRNIAMVFQNYALYPHMSVYKNMAFGLKMRGIKKKNYDARVRETAKILQIDHLLKRKPKALSGGQRQRVALGRAIVRDAKLFLMDEPLSNLDAKLRNQMRAEIIDLHRRMKATTIYVTHDQTEAMTMATRIVLLKDGVIQQVGTPQEIYEQPRNTFVAGFIGTPPMNMLDFSLKGQAFEFSKDTSVQVPKTQLDLNNEHVSLGVRSEHIVVEKVASDQFKHDFMLNEARIELVERIGSNQLLYCVYNDETYIASTDSYVHFNVGDHVNLGFNLKDIHIFDQESGDIIQNASTHQVTERQTQEV